MAAKKKSKKKVAVTKAKKSIKTKSSTKKKVATVKKTAKKATAKAAKKVLKKSVKSTKKIVKKSPIKKTTLLKTAAAPTKPVQIVDYAKVITPLLDRLVVKVLSGERVTAGGLIIPDTASMAGGYLKAKVLAVGTGIKTKKGNLRPLDVKVGDTVLFSQHAGTKVEFNAEELQIIHESDVMGVVQE